MKIKPQLTEPDQNGVAKEEMDSSNHPLKEDLDSIKHPLEHTWSLWLFTNEHKKNWEKNQRKLTDFNTVEDYWCLYHYTKPPTELVPGQDYSVFKKGITPTWEDDTNRPGGSWFLIMERLNGHLDSYWLDVVLLMIGENFGDFNENVCGAAVNVRENKRDRITIWTRNTNEKSNMAIGRKIKEQLGIKNRIHFYAHNKKSHLFTC